MGDRDRPVRGSSDRRIAGWWPRILARVFGRASPAGNRQSHHAHSAIIDGRGTSGTSGGARPCTTGSDASGTIRGSGAAVSGNDDREPGATGSAAARDHGGTDDHFGDYRRGLAATTSHLDGRDAASTKGRASGNTACPRSRAVGSTEHSRTDSPERSEGIGTSNSSGTGTSGSDGRSNQQPPNNGGTSGHIAGHDASGSRNVGGGPPADPDGAAAAGV
jgi:hypothetical protein